MWPAYTLRTLQSVDWFPENNIPSIKTLFVMKKNKFINKTSQAVS